MHRFPRLARYLVPTLLLLAPRLALAAPGGPAGVENFGRAILDFLTGTGAVIVFGIGLAVAAWSIILGSRDGLMKAVGTCIGGVILFSIDSIIDFVQGAAGG